MSWLVSWLFPITSNPLPSNPCQHDFVLVTRNKRALSILSLIPWAGTSFLFVFCWGVCALKSMNYFPSSPSLYLTHEVNCRKSERHTTMDNEEQELKISFTWPVPVLSESNLISLQVYGLQPHCFISQFYETPHCLMVMNEYKTARDIFIPIPSSPVELSQLFQFT